MRPLPTDKKHGVIHTVRVTPDQLDKIADVLNIPKDKRANRLRTGDEIHIVREAAAHELK